MTADATVADWVFLASAQCLIEFAPLRLPPPPARCHLRASVVTWWRDPTSTTGWASAAWDAGERGWVIPGHLVRGDVIEFRLAAVNAADGLAAPGWDLRWFGWLRQDTVLALVIEGPYPDVISCGHAAAMTVDEIRLAQLAELDPDISWAPDGADIVNEA